MAAMLQRGIQIEFWIKKEQPARAPAVPLGKPARGNAGSRD